MITSVIVSYEMLSIPRVQKHSFFLQKWEKSSQNKTITKIFIATIIFIKMYKEQRQLKIFHLNRIKEKEYFPLTNSSGEIQQTVVAQNLGLESDCQNLNFSCALPLISWVTFIKLFYFFVYHFLKKTTYSVLL